MVSKKYLTDKIKKLNYLKKVNLLRLKFFIFDFDDKI